MATNSQERSTTIQTYWKRAKPLLIVAILTGALLLLYRQLRTYHYHDLVPQVKAYPRWTIALALAITACNYFILTFYDVLAMRYIKKSLPHRNVALASFMSYVFSYNIGLSLFGSSTIRYRFYASWKLDGNDIARIIAFCVTTFWIGLATMGGISLALTPTSLSMFPKFGIWTNLLGVAMVLMVVLYCVACFRNRQTLHFKAFSIGFPPPRIALQQILVSSLDWVLAACVLYVLLPLGRPSFLSFLGIFVIAQLAGATSHIPGALGVFDSLIMVPSRSLFTRHSALIAPTSIIQWSVSVATVLVAALWLGFFSYKHVQYSNEFWWTFAL